MNDPRQPATPEEARRIINDVNASNRLEGIPSDPASDRINYDALTGAISDEQAWEQTREKIIRENPTMSPEQQARLNQLLRPDET